MAFTIKLNGDVYNNNSNIREFYNELLPNPLAYIFTNICKGFTLLKTRHSF